jgi:hypothetical protein
MAAGNSRRFLLSCHRRHCNVSVDVIIVVVLALTTAVSAQRSSAPATGKLPASDVHQRIQQTINRRRQSIEPRPQFIRTGAPLPTDPWQLFNITVKHNGNKTEGMLLSCAWMMLRGKGLLRGVESRRKPVARQLLACHAAIFTGPVFTSGR